MDFPDRGRCFWFRPSKTTEAELPPCLDLCRWQKTDRNCDTDLEPYGRDQRRSTHGIASVCWLDSFEASRSQKRFDRALGRQVRPSVAIVYHRLDRGRPILRRSPRLL